MSAILKYPACLFALLVLAACAPQNLGRTPPPDYEKNLRAGMQTVPVEPVTYVDISPDDFVIAESPARLDKYRDLEVSLNVKDVSVLQALTLLFDEYGVDHFIPDRTSGLGGKISLTYSGPLPNLLDTLSSQFGYYFIEEHGVLRISDERVYVFSIPPMITEQLGGDVSSSSSQSQSNGSAGATPAMAGGSDGAMTAGGAGGQQATDFLATLKNMGARETVIDQMNSLVSFKCSNSALPGIKAYLRKLRDNVAIVSLDVLVAEVELSNEFSRGINWDALYIKDDITAGFNLPLDLPSELKPGSLSFGLIDGKHWDISSILSFLESQGDTEILQKPTITVLNGNRAFLKAGREIPYVDEITITPTQIGGIVVSLQEVTFASILEGIEIEILPKVRDELVTLSIRGAITGVIEFVERETGQGGTVAKPVSTTRDVQSVTALKAGEILKIGGIIVSDTRKSDKGVPGAKATGLTDFLLTSKEDSALRSEIVILVKPQIIRFREKQA